MNKIRFNNPANGLTKFGSSRPADSCTHMLTFRPLLPILLFSILLLSCEKEVNVNLTSGEPQLVVNGQIELGQPPFIVLTRSIGYFTKVDLQTLQNSFIHDAVIKVSDGSREVTLREYNFDSSSGGTAGRFYFYTLDVSDPASLSFSGEADKSYHLHIESEGRTYTSTTKIPNPKGVDSVVAEPLKQAPANAPTAMQLVVYYTDPDTPGNAVRYFTKRNNEPYYPGFSSVFDDAIVNGARDSRYPLLAGSPRGEGFTDSTGFIFRGDTVTLKWAAIDRGVFNFYQTFEYAVGTVGNPFASPINVLTNIAGGGLGIWAGYGSTYTTIIVPK